MWCQFEQSAVEDETISNTFSSRGIFKVWSEEEVVKYPVVQASIQNKKMVIAIDKSIVLLEDEMVAKCSEISFASMIDVIAISSSGNLIICGLRDGRIHGIFIKGIPLFEVCIDLDDQQINPENGKTFIAVQELDGRFYITSSNGSVYRLSLIDETPLETNLNISLSENEPDKIILEPVTLERVLTSRGLYGISAAILLPDYGSYTDDLLFIAGIDNVLHFRSTSSDGSKITLPECFQGVKNIFNFDNFVTILTNSGHLLEICPITRLIDYNGNKHIDTSSELLIDEIIVMECNDENIELLVLTKLHPKDDDRFIKIIEFPSYKCNSELDVGKHAWLVVQPKCSVNLYYLCGNRINGSNCPSEVEMVLVSETLPVERFKKLVAKGHLEEAEEFGRQFELSLQPIYESKAKRILLEFTVLSENNPELLEQRFDELLSLLRQIESKDFFRNNRMFPIPSRSVLERYLCEILRHLNVEDHECDVIEIEEQLLRLQTLSIIDPYNCNGDWQKFIYHPNLVKMIVGLFKSDILMACLIWKRHSSVIMPNLDDEGLFKLLNMIPSNTEAFNVVQWLRQFSSTVGSTHPNIMPNITEWVVQKTRALQYSSHWPEIGLEFSSKVMEIFEDIQYIHSDIRRQHERNIEKLRDLTNSLEDLVVLKKNYNLIITLDNYLQDSTDETTIYILERVHLKSLKSLVNDFLYPIYQEKGTSPVIALKRYISMLVASRNMLSTWLERAVVCTELLHSEDDRLESALLVLQSSTVPWPETVTPLVRLRHSTHPLALKINSEYEFQVIKMMKVKYGWPADSASDINLNLFMQRIVKMDLPDMIADIRTLTKAAPNIASSANFNCCYQLVRRGKADLAHEYFKTLQAEKNERHTNDIIELFANVLESAVLLPDQIDEQHLEQQRQLIDFFKLIAKHLDDSTRKRVVAIEHRFILQHKFQLCVVNVQQLTAHDQRVNLLNKGIDNILERSQAAVGVTRFIINEINALTAVLELPRLHGVWRISQRMRCLPLTCALTYSMLALIADGTATLIHNRDDIIELALELIAQQMLAVSNKYATNYSRVMLSEDMDPLALLLAHELLVRVYIDEKKQPTALLSLLKYLHIVYSVYGSTAIEDFYGGNESSINEIICKSLDTSELHLNNSTLSMNGDNSFDIKPTVNNTKKRQSVSIFDNFELQPHTQQPNHSCSDEQLAIVRFIARSLLFLIVNDMGGEKNFYFEKIRQQLPEDARVDVEGARTDFYQSLEQLNKAKKHNVWYVIAQYLLDHQQQNMVPEMIQPNFVSNKLGRVFRHALSHRDINFISLFVMLITDENGDALLRKLEGDLRSDQQKINLLTLLEMYNIHIQNPAVDDIRAKRVKHFYYMDFCQQDPAIRGKFNSDVDSVQQLLKEFHHKQLDTQLLKRMSRDFDLDYQQLLITQLVNTLAAQELQYEIKTDGYGDEKLVLLSSVESMRQLCQPYLNEITNTELLGSKLLHFMNDGLNIYFYELYLCIIEILVFIDAAPKEMHIWNSILQFMKHKMVTRRRNRPGQLETDTWLQSQTELSVLPKIARYRLPFKPIVEQPLKDILDNELNVDNCESWFPLIQMHTMLKGSQEIAKMLDYFCMSAVKNSIAEYKAKNESEAWHLQPTNNAFLKSIQRLIRHVHNPTKAFLILYFVANYAPEGADQVEASYECYKYAQEHESDITDPKYQEQLVKIRRKYPTLKTQHLLYVYGLTDDKLMRLVENPMDLIYKLYHHEILLQPSSKLDINAVVREIAQLHDLDVEVLQFQLLQKWLSVTLDCLDGTALEETFYEDQSGTTNGNVIADDTGSAAENVIRAHYIFSSWPKKEAVKFLVAHMFTTDGAVNTAKQLQLCECLVKLNDGSATFSNMLEQREYIAIKCVHELKKLGYQFSLEKFKDCNKIQLLKTLWQRNGQTSHALTILVNICLGYDIYLGKVWNGILKRMTQLNMIRELSALVDALSCHAELLQTDGLTAAWECVLLQPFKSANRTRSFEQEDLLHKTLFRLQSCPVLHKLKLLEFAQHCVHLERTYMAAVLLALTKNPQSKEQIKQLIVRNVGKSFTDTARKEILALEDAGILPVILNVALKELNL